MLRSNARRSPVAPHEPKRPPATAIALDLDIGDETVRGYLLAACRKRVGHRTLRALLRRLDSVHSFGDDEQRTDVRPAQIRRSARHFSEGVIAT